MVVGFVNGIAIWSSEYAISEWFLEQPFDQNAPMQTGVGDKKNQIVR